MPEYISKVKKHSHDLLKKMGFQAEPIVVQKESVVFVNIEMESPGLLIGRGGEGLEALQHILRLLLTEEIMANNINIILDIAGYRSKKIENIKKIARDKAYLVLSTGIEEALLPMSSYERRTVHLICANIADVETESVGEGRERRVVIKPKKSK